MMGFGGTDIRMDGRWERMKTPQTLNHFTRCGRPPCNGVLGRLGEERNAGGFKIRHLSTHL
eukprot:11191053-Lingulodinium_polyedra.AAC.1